MAVKSFDDTNGNGMTREDSLDSASTVTFSSRAKNTNYGGAGAALVATLGYEGDGSVARKVGSTGGVGYSVNGGGITSRNTTNATYRTVLAKVTITTYNVLNAAGVDWGCGSGTVGNNQHYWTLGEDGTIPAPGFQYPLAGGWILKPVDLTLRAFLRGTTGTPSETAINSFMVWADVSATAGSDRNLAIDSIDYIESGFHVVGGDSTDPDIEFDDFVAEDEGEGSTNFARIGLWRKADGILSFFGKNVVGRTEPGTVTASAFTDSFKTLVCPGGYVRGGFNALEFDTGDVATVVTLDNITIIGAGRSSQKLLFDTTDSGSGGDVNVSTDEIAYVGHGLQTAEQILYSQEGEAGAVVSLTGGESNLVTGTTGRYYYAIATDADNFGVASSFANALAGTHVAMTAFASQIQSFARTPDTRPDLKHSTDSTGGTLDLTNCVLTSLRLITLDSGGTLTACTMAACFRLSVLTTAASPDPSIVNCAIVGSTTSSGAPFAIIEDPSNISGCSFTQGDHGGHAIEITSPGTYTFSGNTFSGYSGTTGSNPTANSGSLDAAIYNDSGGSVTLNVSGGGDIMSVRNGASSDTVVQASITITFINLVNGTEVRVYRVSDGGEEDGTETVTGGQFAAGLQASTDYDIVIIYPGYIPIRRESQSFAASGDVDYNQQVDLNYENA